MGNIGIILQYEKASIKIRISKNKTIYELKSKIYELIGIKESHQILFFKEKELVNNNILSYYNIENNSNLKLIVKSTENLEIAENDLNQKEKNALKEKEKVKVSNTETKKMEIENIKKLKLKNHQKEKKEQITQDINLEAISKKEIKVYKTRGITPKDPKDISKDFENKKELIEGGLIAHFVGYGGSNDIHFCDNFDLTIGELKQFIYQAYHLPVHRQKLCFGGNWFYDDSEKIININFNSFSFGSNDNSEENDFTFVKVNDIINNSSVNIKIDIYGDVEGQILRYMKLDSKTGTTISFLGIYPYFEYSLYSAYKRGDDISFDLYRAQESVKMKIIIEEFFGKKHDIYTDSDEYIINIMKKFEEIAGKHDYRLIYNCHFLDPHLKISDYSIRDNSKIKQVFRLRGG